MKAQRIQSTTLSNILSTMDEDTLRHMKDRMMIACKIADALKEKGISQKSFASMIGKCESEISDWLSGNRNFTIDTLSDIEHCLHISLINRSLPNSTIKRPHKKHQDTPSQSPTV